jgi:hypothetical protein
VKCDEELLLKTIAISENRAFDSSRVAKKANPAKAGDAKPRG